MPFSSDSSEESGIYGSIQGESVFGMNNSRKQKEVKNKEKTVAAVPESIDNSCAAEWDTGLSMEELWKLPEFQKAGSLARSKMQEYLMELDVRYQARTGNSFIRLIESRMKSLESIERKLERKGFEKNTESMLTNLHDLSGVHVICYDIKQIYWIARRIADDGQYEIVKVKDYVRKPKRNGYESYHVVCNVPVSVEGRIHIVEVELQIRTILMDAWASLDTKLRYKKKEPLSDEMELQIRKYAKWSRRLDKMVRNIMELSQENDFGN